MVFGNPRQLGECQVLLALSHMGNIWGSSTHCTGRVTISTEPSSYEHRCVWWALGPAFRRVQADVLTGRALGRCRVGMRETQGSKGVSGQEPRGFAWVVISRSQKKGLVAFTETLEDTQCRLMQPEVFAIWEQVGSMESLLGAHTRI